MSDLSIDQLRFDLPGDTLGMEGMKVTFGPTKVCPYGLMPVRRV
jgi:hypothetical protein